MTRIIEWEDATGAPPDAPVKGVSSNMSGGKIIEWEQATGEQPWEVEARQGPSKVELAKDIGKRALGLTAATGDLLLGVPGAIAGHLMNVGTRLYAAAKGESSKIAGQAGELAEDLGTLTIPGTGVKVPLEGLKTPLQTILKATMGVEPWNQEIVSEAIESAGKGIEKASAGRITSEDVKLGFGVFMDTAGAAGLKASAKAITAKPKPKTGAEARTTYGEEIPPEEAPITPGEAPFRQQMPEIPTKAEQAKTRRTRAQDLKEAFKDAETVDYRLFQANEAMESRAAELVKEAEAKGRDTSPYDQAALGEEVSRIINEKPGHERTAEDLIRIREWNRQAFRSQQGRVDPDMLPYIVAGLTGVVGAVPLYNYLKHLGETDPEGKDEGLFQIGTLGGGLLAAGAVRVKGSGVWPKAAVARLAEPLAGKLATIDPAFGAKPFAETLGATWSDKAIRNHLNKYFGTAEDPLAGIKIPMLGDEVTWGEVADKVIKSASIPKRLEMMKRGEAQIGESVWDVEKNVSGNTAAHFNALQSYLSHAGDFAREFIPPEKLGQYDLVRLIKETAKQDEKQAKAMEKARILGTGTEPYKTYPDGMKWVEVKSEEALKNEGDVMGHCVGGYCEAVHEGSSRIFSLRDKKGMSHVTVEVAPSVLERETVRREGRLTQEQVAQQMREQGARPSDYNPSILQIKGKQNRAPIAEYLPYVQDFVRKAPDGSPAKWGEVGDLQNTGLVKDLTGKYITLAERDALEAAHPRRPGREQGSIDPKLLAGLGLAGGAAAIGAYVAGEDHATRGALLGAALGALVGTARGRQALSEGGKSLDYVAGTLSTRLRNVSEPLMRRGRHFEEAVLTGTHEAIQRVDPFLVTLNKLPKEIQGFLNRAILSNDDVAVRRIIAQAAPEALSQWQAVRTALKEIGGELSKGKWLSHLREDYFPRIVTDVEGLLNALGGEAKNRLDTALLTAEKKSIKIQGRGLTDLEKSLIINAELRKRPATSGRPGFTRERGVETITPELEQFYATPTESLHTYLRNAIFELEKAKFFGRDLAMSKEGGTSYIDLDTSIGNLVRGEREAGRITQEQIAELSSMLHSRFGPGERGATGWIQDARNLANLGLLGNAVSAATQLGDAVMAPFHADIRGTAAAIAQRFAGKSPIRARDYGLVDHLSEEFVSTRGTAKALNTAFRWSGFQGIDLFGKDTILNASLNRFQRLSQTARGQQTLMREHGRAFEGDMAQLIQDLQSKKMTPLVKELLFNKLSDAQPITKMEVPQAYLDMPNGRVLYMLKTFMLKQMDIARVQGWNEIKHGFETKDHMQVARGMRNLVAYGTLLGMSGAATDMVKDWMLGRPFDPRWEDIPLNALKTFGWSQYTLDMAKGGHPFKAVANITAAPYQMLDDIVSDSPKSWNYLPIVGKLIYPHTEAGELAEAKRTQRLQREDDPVYQAKKARQQKLKEQRMKDPRWRRYYLEKAKGLNPTRPDR